MRFTIATGPDVEPASLSRSRPTYTSRNTGCTNAAVLLTEITARGYRGRHALVRQYLNHFPHHGMHSETAVQLRGARFLVARLGTLLVLFGGSRFRWACRWKGLVPGCTSAFRVAMNGEVLDRNAPAGWDGRPIKDGLVINGMESVHSRVPQPVPVARMYYRVR
ncbi:hypothetical protein [Kibdelosporangium phytohabitans]|uniref:hypothetical protein n=1 Tax=Kibdelosporangium phytohabitans TaxID=860235 RepID=UPI0012FAFD42|nr:hypothetical protein [Kibdelosporangium phytohabitans]MBE1461498.1 hypothetical protein [Kibdelosporangium phytohabitans]